jgi:anti-sigma factor RsiW
MTTGTHMNTHLTQDDLVLHYYGEMNGAEETRTTSHLSACAECHANYRRLQRVLAVVDESAQVAPDLPESFERTVWARLEPNLRRERVDWQSWFVLSPQRLAWAAGIVLLVAGAFFAGRLAPRTPDVVTTQTMPVPDRLREQVLLVDVGEHLDRSQMVLTELGNRDEAIAEAQGTVDISGERARAEQLVAANRLYRQTAVATGDTAIVDLLDELEHVLIDLAASPEQMSSQDLDEVRRRIESRSLLFKVRVLSSEIRQRQRSIRQERTGQRSSL